MKPFSLAIVWLLLAADTFISSMVNGEALGLSYWIPLTCSSLWFGVDRVIKAIEEKEI